MKDYLRKLYTHPLYQQYNSFILPVVSVVICFGLFGLVVYPQILSYIESRKELDELSIKQQLLEEKLSGLEKVNDEIFKKNIEVALMAVPTDKDVTGVISQLLYILNINRLKLNEISFSGAGSTENSDSVQIKLDISGTKDDFKSFINGLNSLPRIVKVSRLEVSASKGGEAIQSALTIQSFYQALPTAIANVSAPLPMILPGETEVLSKIQTNALALPQTPSATTSGTVIRGKTDPFR